jgi:hypothetical protein
MIKTVCEVSSSNRHIGVEGARLADNFALGPVVDGLDQKLGDPKR